MTKSISDLFGDYVDPYRKKKLKELAEKAQPKTAAAGPVTHICSCCGSNQAWYSSDHGVTWQCFKHQSVFNSPPQAK